jgi:menaquinone-specific isochorismate synthase
VRIIPVENFPARDEAALVAFLERCKSEARRKDSPYFGSITVETNFVDPLAILETISEEGNPLWYVERPSEEFALSCGEAVAYQEFSGHARFSEARCFAAEVFSRTIATGDLAPGGAGPTFALAATFEENNDVHGDHPAPLAVFMPRWQVLRKGGRHYAIANAKIEPDSNLHEIAQGIWTAHAKLSHFRNETEISKFVQLPPPILSPHREQNDYEKIVAKALDLLDAESFDKIVLSRKITFDSDRTLSPFALAHQLRERFPDCHTFCLGDRRPGMLVGATPENLLRVEGDRIETEALAGTTARGGNAGTDAQLGQALLDSEKEGREHRLVVESIIRRLQGLGLRHCEEGRPRLLRLSNLQHVRTPLRASLSKNLHPLDILAELHPTPAIGGSPRGSALPHLRELEGFSRDWYSGVAGWFDHEGQGEFVVPLRCGHLNHKQVALYAGSGIVKGSDPVSEKLETDLKLAAMLESLQRT